LPFHANSSRAAKSADRPRDPDVHVVPGDRVPVVCKPLVVEEAPGAILREPLVGDVRVLRLAVVARARLDLDAFGLHAGQVGSTMA
jgi:hypothetical protein